MNKIKFLVYLIVLLFPPVLFADSPITSTPIHDKYIDIDIVLQAEQMGVINRDMANYLHNDNNPIDIKAALINALGWDINGKNNAGQYCQIIYNQPVISYDMMSVSTDEAFVIGYLHAMDNYQNPDAALPYLKLAKNNNSKSYTVNIIYYLVKAQKVMETNFCKAWQYANKVFLNDQLTMDMRADARKIIFDYMSGYKSYCK